MKMQREKHSELDGLIASSLIASALSKSNFRVVDLAKDPPCKGIFGKIHSGLRLPNLILEFCRVSNGSPIVLAKRADRMRKAMGAGNCCRNLTRFVGTDTFYSS